MKLQVENFGIIESALVSIDGLTVICGENDTGKSTIGKLLFAIVKASQKYEDDLGENVIDKVESNISRILTLFSPSALSFLENKNNKEIYEYFRRAHRNLFIHKKISIEDISGFRNVIEEYVDNYTVKDEALRIIENISNVLKNKPNENELKRNALNKALYSEFKKIRSESSIIFSENDDKNLIKFRINNSNVSDVIFENKMNIEDITYIESPFILQFRKMFVNAMTLVDDKPTRSWMRDTVSLHLKDLARKLNSYDLQNLIYDAKIENISKQIDDIISGDFYYDEDQQDFVLRRKNSNFSSMNIASGIKALGLLNTLLKGNIINSNSLLILDEPETNLHPKWQNEYARIICELVKNNIKIIAVTHSPYMISALEHHSKDISFKNFYWTSKNSQEKVTFEDKTESVMSDIVQKFANVFSELD